MKTQRQLADTQQGWVKLQRSTLDSPMMKNPILLQIYVWCVLKANHQPKWFSFQTGKGANEIYCDVGQFITGRMRAAEELGMPGSTWYKNIKKIEDYGYLQIESNNKFSLITVVNVDNVVVVKKPIEQQTNRKSNSNATAKEQQRNTNNNNDKGKKVNKENNNKSNYSLFTNSKNLKSLNKILQKEYLQIVKLIEKELSILLSNLKPLNPTHFKLLRKAFSFKEIQSTLVSLNSDPIPTDRKSLYLLLKDTLKKDSAASSNTNESKEEKDYIAKAYELLKRKIAKELPRVASIQQQLSLETFTTIFNKYDWEDIICKFDDLNEWEDVSKQKSLSKILYTFLYKDKNVHPLDEGKTNSFIKEQKRKEREKVNALEKQKEEEEFQIYFKSVKDIDAWSNLYLIHNEKDKETFVRDYCKLIENMESEEYPKFTHLSKFTLEEAIQFANEHQDLSWISDMLDEFHKSSTVENHTSAYDFLLEQTIAQYKPGWEDDEDED